MTNLITLLEGAPTRLKFGELPPGRLFRLVGSSHDHWDYINMKIYRNGNAYCMNIRNGLFWWIPDEQEVAVINEKVQIKWES